VTDYGWTAVPKNSTDQNAAIVANIVRVIGVTDPFIPNVTITSPSGEAFVVQTGEIRDGLNIRFFALQIVVDAADFAPEQIQIDR